jgi:glycosyltransferase involved in cell wall biosynthesis
MKIALITGIYPPDIGGPATYVARFRRYLSEQGVTSTLLTLSENSNGVGDGPFTYRVRRRLPLAGRLPVTVWNALRAARDADVIYANGLPTESTAAAALLGRPLVSKVVGDLAWERSLRRGWTGAPDPETFQAGPSGPAARLLKRHQVTCLRRSRALVVPSRYLQRMVAGWGVPPERIQVIYNGVSPPPSAEERARAAETRFRLITVCRLVPLKGIARMMETVAGLGTGFELVICGDGPLEGELHTFRTEQCGQAAIRFTGRLDGGQLAREFGEAQAYLLNSSTEGLPHSMLEACRFGLPMISSAVGGVTELLRDGENGLIFDPEEPQGMADAIRRLAGDRELWSACSQGAVQTALDHSFDATAGATLELLRRVAGGGGRDR